MTELNITYKSSEEAVRQAMLEAFQEAKNATTVGGTTLSVAQLIRDKETGQMKAVIANVGDSPVYIMKKDGTFKALHNEQTAWRLFLDNIKEYQSVVNNSAEKSKKKTALETKIWNILKKISRMEDEEIELFVSTLIKRKNIEKSLMKTVQSYRDKTNDELEDDLVFHAYHSLNSAIYQSISSDKKLDETLVKINSVEVDDGDMIFVVSDGISDNLLESEIRDFAKPRKPARLNLMMCTSNEKASDDNAYQKGKDDCSFAAIIISQTR